MYFGISSNLFGIHAAIRSSHRPRRHWRYNNFDGLFCSTSQGPLHLDFASRMVLPAWRVGTKILGISLPIVEELVNAPEDHRRSLQPRPIVWKAILRFFSLSHTYISLRHCLYNNKNLWFLHSFCYPWGTNLHWDWERGTAFMITALQMRHTRATETGGTKSQERIG